jgi:hypothetical protein
MYLFTTNGALRRFIMAQNNGSKVVKKGALYESLCRQVLEWVDEDVRNNYESILITNTWGNRYRINVYQKYYNEDSAVPSYRIAHSYFCHLVADKLFNETLHRQPKLE